MIYVKTEFSIKDLENISGIKAHTIRIWEKRYRLFAPNRTDTNIRYYDVNSLNKLLNIKLLYDNGVKISKIADLSDHEIITLVKESTTNSLVDKQVINALTMSMFHFDPYLFESTYAKLLATKTFRELFKDVFLPFLNELGMMWQTQTITPAHEHFITNIIKQKIIFNTEKVFDIKNKNSKTFVLYLPDNEIHEIGLLYLNYELNLKGYNTIYLGQTIPLDSLYSLQTSVDAVEFVSYFTVEPATENVSTYVANFMSVFQKEQHVKLHLMGEQVRHLEQHIFSENVYNYKSPYDFLSTL